MTIFELTDTIGIIAFSLSGFIKATDGHLDILGICISSFLTALGGGISRDIIVNTTPFSLSHLSPVIYVLGTIIFAIIFKVHKKTNIESKAIFIISDAIGLVSFSITGALIGLEHHLSFFGILILAFLTAVGGGGIRDILMNKVPFFLIEDFYASISLIIGTILYILNVFSWNNFLSIPLIFIFMLFLRLFAYYKKWHLPKLK